MSDEVLPMPANVAAALNPELLAKMEESCRLALAKQLNKNEQDPQLKALADKWKNMDKFSKRELGQPDTIKASTLAQRNNQTAVAPGQEVTVTGPATIMGGKVEDVKPITPSDPKPD